MKCDECLLKHKAKWAGSDDDWCSANHYSDDEWIPCHLTPDHQRIIDAMIRGVFNCGHCRNGEPVFTDRGYAPIIHCLSFDSKWGSGYFCSAWQERKEGGQ